MEGRRATRIISGVVLAAALAAFVASTVEASTNPLRRVWIAGGRVHASFSVPSSMTPYALTFSAPSVHLHEVYYVLPGLTGQDAVGKGTRTSWVSDPIIAQVLKSASFDNQGNYVRTKYAVWLLYAPTATCTRVGRCTGVRRSPTQFLTVGGGWTPSGPLVDQASASGDYAGVNVAGTVKYPNTNTFEVVVKSSPTGQNVHIDYDISCTRGTTVKGHSGGWDDTTPVDDTNHILASPVLADDCIISVGASLTDGNGVITLAVYSGS